MRSRAPVASLFLLGLGSLFASVFLFRFRPALLLITEIARPAAGAIILLLAALAAGQAAVSLARRIIGAEGPTPFSLPELLLVGYPLFGTVAGLLCWLTTGFVIPLTMLTAVAGAVQLMRNRSTVTWRLRVPLALVIPSILAVIEAVTPTNSPDELIYKLAIPQQYLFYGRMLELPLASNSYLTLGAGLSDLAALAMSGPLAPKLARLGLYFATLIVLSRFARRIVGSGSQLLVAMVAWTPTLMIIAGWAWNEWLVIGLIVVAMDRLERWLDTKDHLDAALSFTAAAAAVATKYTALPWLLAFACVAVIRMRDRRILVRGALVIALFGSFFYLRNLVWTGSPFAPLLLPDSPKVTNYRSGGAFSGWKDLLHGYDITDREVIDESLGIILPLATIASLGLLFRRERTIQDLLIIGGLQMPILLTIAPGSRNIINGVLPLALAGGVLMAESYRDSAAALRVLLKVTLVAAFAVQLVLVGFALDTLDFVRYLTGGETIGQYFTRTRNFVGPFTWIAKSTPATSRILLLGETRTLYLRRQAVSGSNLDGPRIAHWLQRFPNPDALRGELARMGITHVLIYREGYVVGERALTSIQNEIILQVPIPADAVLKNALKKYGTLRYFDSRYLIFELVR